MNQGTPSGEAFIQMDSEANAEATTLNKHRKFMISNNKRRYIEVLQCSGEDMNLVLTSGLPPIGMPPPVSTQTVLPTGGFPGGAAMLPKQLGLSPGQKAFPLLRNPLTFCFM
jgi:epithelial splicing regulatory protein 1/2